MLNVIGWLMLVILVIFVFGLGVWLNGWKVTLAVYGTLLVVAAWISVAVLLLEVRHPNVR